MKRFAGIILLAFVALVKLQAQCATPPDAATVNITQPTCALQSGTITIISPLGDYEYNIDGGAYQSGISFNNVSPGSHQILVRRSTDITCVSNPSSATILPIPAPPTVPSASEIIQPTCSSPSGTITFVSQPDVEYSVGSAYQSSPTFPGLTPQIYTLTVRSTTDNTCITAAASTVNLISPAPPSTPTTASITQPTCSYPTGTIVFTTQSGVEYSIGSGYQSSPTFSGLSPATYTLTVRNISDITCITPAASTVTLNTPVLPSVPTAASVIQPTCATPSGTIVFTTQSGVEYSVGSDYQSSPTFSSLSPATYTLYTRSTSDNSCSTSSISPITINPAPSAPSAPTVSSITQPTCSLPTGTIVFNAQSGVEYSVGYGYQTSPTFSGLVPRTYTLTVRSTTDNSCITAAASTVNLISPAPPSVPTTASITQPTCSNPTGTIVFTTQSGVEYSIGSGYQSSPTFSGLSPATYTLTVRNISDITCITPAASTVTLNTPVLPSVPTAASVIQPTCATPSGTIVFTAQSGVEYSVGSGYQSSPTFSSLSPATYTLYTRSTSDNSCITSSISPITINQVPTAPSAPTVSSITQPTCSLPTGTIVFNAQSGVEYSVGYGYQTSPTFSGLVPRTYTLTVRSTTDNSCITAAASTVNLISPAPPSVPTTASITQPTCSNPTGTIVFTTQSGVEYSVGSGYQSSPTFSSLPPATYTLYARSFSDNSCITSSSSPITINQAPSAPSVPTVSSITQPTCSLPTGTIVFTAQSGVEYSVGYGYQTSPAFSGLVPRTYTLTVRSTLDNSCITAAAATVTINAQPRTPTAPIIGTITQPNCGVATGSIPISGLPSSGTWTLTRSPGNITTSGTGTTTTISSLASGTYTFTVTNSSGCTSASSLAAVINVQPVTPSAPITGIAVQPTCSVATGSVPLTGLPSSGTWTVTRSPGSVTSTGSGSTTTISGIPQGSYTFTVTNASGCISAASASVTINSQPVTPSTPVIGTITHPTCSVPTGSVPLSGLPSSGTWTITMSPGAVTTSGSGSTTTITGLPAGNYTFTVTNSSGCTSSASSAAILNSQPLTPSVPVIGAIVQPSCTVATGSVPLSGLPSSGTWTLTRSPGNITTTGSGTSTTITGLAAGTYTYSVTNSSGCTSVSTASITIDPQPVTPSAPLTGTAIQPTCSVATGSVPLTGLPATGTWTVTRTPGAVTTSGTGTGTTISGIAAGTYTFTVTNASGCISTASSVITINEQPVTPAAPATSNLIQPTCTVATGSVTLGSLPTSGTWTLTRTPGNITTTGTGSTTTIAGLPTGTYTYTVTNASGCTSLQSAVIAIDPQPVTPSAPLAGNVTQPTCTTATGSIQLTGLPATGAWTLSRTPGNITSAGSGASTTIAGLAPGTYSFTVINSSGCTSASSPDIVINAQPVTPSAPVIGVITQPTCSVATGSTAISGLPATGNWTITRMPGAVTTSGSGTATTISGLTAGTYAFTVTNSVGCTSSGSQNVAINTQPPTPSAPQPGAIVQPSLDNPAGSIALSGLPSSGTWTLHRQPGGINTSGTGTGTTVSGLEPGSYTFTVTNSAGCTSAPTGSIGSYLLKLYGTDNKIIRSGDTIKIASPEAGYFTFRVESNSDWKVTDNALWFKAVKESPSSIKVTYSENISVVDKSSSLLITYPSHPDIKININQQGRISQLKESKLKNAKLYPNPVGDFLYMNHGGYDLEKIVVTIADLQGHIIFIRSFERITAGEITEINVSGLPVGQFLFNITDGSESRTFQFIKY